MTSDPLLQAWHHAVEITLQRERADRAEAESARLTRQLADAINLGTEYLRERNEERTRIERMAEAVGDVLARAEKAEHRADSAQGEVKRLADALAASFKARA